MSKNNLLVDGIEVEWNRNDKLRTMNKEIDKNITAPSLLISSIED